MNQNSNLGPLVQEALDAVDNPVFVIGTMRSGTGFMGLQLNQAPDLIGCPFELRRIWHSIGKVPMAWDFCGLDCPGLDEEFINQVPLDALKEAFAREVAKNFSGLSWRSGLRFLSKNPHLCNKIELVSRLFPKAQFVWTIRRMEEVVCSLKNLFEREEFRVRGIQHIWPKAAAIPLKCRCFSVNRDGLRRPLSGDHVFPGGDIVHLAQYWLESNLSMLSYYENCQPLRMSIASQSTLLSNPMAVATQLETFLSLRKDTLAGIPSAIDKNMMQHWTTPLTPLENDQLRQFRLDHAASFRRLEGLMN